MVVLASEVFVYVNDYYHADETALHALETTDDVTVTTDDNICIFTPENPSAGIIFYPGGKVEYTAYTPLMQAYAEQGVLCVLVKMPCNLAVLDVNAADGVMKEFPEIETWYMAGHSLGGSMAASYISEHEEEFAGLILMAAYSTEDLSDTDLEVLSIYGSEDEVLNLEKYDEYKENLPENTQEIVIDGGCHAYFGSYGPQEGDGIPSITMEEQIQEVVDASVYLY